MALPLKGSLKKSETTSPSMENLLREQIVKSGYVKQPKHDRDAMMAQIFASKKSMNVDLAMTQSSAFKSRK